jgi:hypothetical protein
MHVGKNLWSEFQRSLPRLIFQISEIFTATRKIESVPELGLGINISLTLRNEEKL